MKTQFNLIYLQIISIVLLLSACASQKNSNVSYAINYDSLIENQQYTFVAHRASPMEDSRLNPRLLFNNMGRDLYQLTSLYDLKITKDSIIAFLPYFGRSFSPKIIDPANGGIKFTSTDFDYKKLIRKKNYEITINPNDADDVQRAFLTITPAGYATLQILSQNRTAITFFGRIEANK